MKQKKFLVLVIAFLVVVILVSVIYAIKNKSTIPNSNNNDKTITDNNVNANDNIVTDNNVNKDDNLVTEIECVKNLGNVEISNIKITNINANKCMLTATIKNNSEEYIPSQNVEIVSIDENGKEKDIFGGIMSELNGNEEAQFETYVLKDISYTKDIIFKAIDY